MTSEVAGNQAVYDSILAEAQRPDLNRTGLAPEKYVVQRIVAEAFKRFHREVANPTEAYINAQVEARLAARLAAPPAGQNGAGGGQTLQGANGAAQAAPAGQSQAAAAPTNGAARAALSYLTPQQLAAAQAAAIAAAIGGQAPTGAGTGANTTGATSAPAPATTGAFPQAQFGAPSHLAGSAAPPTGQPAPGGTPGVVGAPAPIPSRVGEQPDIRRYVSPSTPNSMVDFHAMVRQLAQDQLG